MKSKHLTASSRWLWSGIIFSCPVAGIFLYQAFRNFVTEKEYRFFSERFIDQHLS
jgi:hypothetical protein